MEIIISPIFQNDMQRLDPMVPVDHISRNDLNKLSKASKDVVERSVATDFKPDGF